tara:strand:- start:238 stop:399 length:162 start_codon:yes stop_codon:yes gene_type:complete
MLILVKLILPFFNNSSVSYSEGKLFVLDKNLIPESSSPRRGNKGEGFWKVKAP